ncbi:MAG: hypothetical protein AB1324_03375 [Candidatus Micrarchaeota archaeon]
MKMHFGQLPKGGDRKSADNKVPSWVPPAWQIEQWKRRTPEVDDRPQPRVEIEEMPPERRRDQKRPEEPERGVCIIDFTV